MQDELEMVPTAKGFDSSDEAFPPDVPDDDMASVARR